MSFTWSGSGDLSDANNWDPSGGPPGPGDIGMMNSGSATGSLSVGAIYVNGNVSFDDVQLNLTGIQTSFGMFGLEVNGALAMSGGSITEGPNTAVDVGDSQTGSGTGSFTLTNGASVTTAILGLGYN